MQRRLLAILPSNLKPDNNAGHKRFFTMLQLLVKKYHIEVATRWDERPGTSFFTADQISSYQEKLRLIGIETIANNPAELLNALSSKRYDLIVFEFYETAEKYLRLCRLLQPDARLVVDSVDVHYLREASGVATGHYPSLQVETTKQAELSVYRRSDMVILITNIEHEAMLKEGGMPPMPIIPIVMDTVERSVMKRKQEIVFIGGFAHKPNADGIMWFFSNIWNRVRERIPEATLTIIGSNPTPEIIALNDSPGISVEGFVPEVGPFLDRAAVSIAPLRFGGGMKGKVTEAMAHGIPVVSTSFGAQGFTVRNGIQMIVADAPESFSEGVISLLLDPARAEMIGMAGRDLMAQFCTLPNVEIKMLELTEAVLNAPTRIKPTLASRIAGSAVRLGAPLSAGILPLVKRMIRR